MLVWFCFGGLEKQMGEFSVMEKKDTKRSLALEFSSLCTTTTAKVEPAEEDERGGL